LEATRLGSNRAEVRTSVAEIPVQIGRGLSFRFQRRAARVLSVTSPSLHVIPSNLRNHCELAVQWVRVGELSVGMQPKSWQTSARTAKKRPTDGSSRQRFAPAP